MDTLTKVAQMQQQLGLLNPNPSLGLLEAAEVLQRSLDVALVGIIGFPDDASLGAACGGGDAPASPAPPGGPTAVLLSSFGTGALVLERECVMRGPHSSYARLLRAAEEAAQPGAGGGGGGGGSAAAAGGGADAGAILFGDDRQQDLPRDWRVLLQDARLRSFALVRIGSRGAPLGALLAAQAESRGFDDRDWWRIWLNAAATALLAPLNRWETGFMTRLHARAETIDDPVLFISWLLQSARSYMLRAVNLRVGVRLALLDEQERAKALVFRTEANSKSGSLVHLATGNSAHAAHSGALGVDPDTTVVTVLDLAGNTLLESAMAMRKARFVRSTSTYLQTCQIAARDLFVGSTDTVASVVVVPLVIKDIPFGALYFTLDTPSDFVNLQDPLLGFVAAVSLLVHHRLAGRTRVLWRAMSEASRVASARLPTSPSLQRRSAGSAGGRREGGSAAGDDGVMRLITDEGGSVASGADCGQYSGADAAAVVPGVELDGAPGGPAERSELSCALSTVSSKRLFTGAMMELVQSEIERNRSASRTGDRPSSFANAGSWLLPDLAMERVLGVGGYGTVWKGTWKKLPAAIKVFYARQNEREAMKDAIEMAVLSSAHHPGIVGVYACYTDMVEIGETDSLGTSSGGSAPGGAGGASGQAVRPRYRRLMPGEDHDGVVCSIVVMEYCDAGTLRQAVKGGAFHRRLAGGQIGVDLSAILEVLLEVACSILYFHDLQLIHCDIKADNVLLKTDPSRPLGFIPKLADFGLVKVLKDDYIRNRSGAGTVTHLAPEMLVAGSRLTTAVDVYAFGVLMYELYTGHRPYHGLTRDAILAHVRSQQLRPTFPPGTPRSFAQLAARCWGQDPGARPAFPAVVEELTKMLEAVEAAPVEAPQPAAAAAAAAAAPDDRQGHDGAGVQGRAPASAACDAAAAAAALRA